jgi:hypothetical protein
MCTTSPRDLSDAASGCLRRQVPSSPRCDRRRHTHPLRIGLAVILSALQRRATKVLELATENGRQRTSDRWMNVEAALLSLSPLSSVLLVV